MQFLHRALNRRNAPLSLAYDLGKGLRQQPLAEMAAQAFGGVSRDIRSLVDDLPAQVQQLAQKRLFYLRAFR